jgi:prepilin-type N-terminal cleavage/methylation domain-containing protein
MKMWNKFRNTSGFSLTEVMIGIMILTVAIVSASNLLVSLVKTNRLNVQTLQAYYLAQEGLEAVRNIRDTNWLHNLDFKGEGGVYQELEVGGSYAVFLEERGWRNSRPDEGMSLYDLRSLLSPWSFISSSSSNPFNDVFAVVEKEFSGKAYYSSSVIGSSDESVFYRHIEILDACDNDPALSEAVLPEDCGDFILVRSVVNWKDGSRDRDFSIEEVLSNWKGGAL